MPNRPVKAASPLAPDLAQIEDFLVNGLGRDWFHLLSSDPNSDRRQMVGYVAENVEDALDWVVRQQAKGHGVYYALNAPGSHQVKKAKVTDLRTLYGAHVDLDLPKGMDRNSPEAEAYLAELRERLSRCKLWDGCPWIVMSGNGLQAIWFFDEPMRATKENQDALLTLNLRLAKQFGGDHCHNIDRILRLPGTVNYPDAKKRARGCSPILTMTLDTHSGLWSMEDFARLPKVDAVSVQAPPSRVDYTKFDYRDWEPWTWRDVQRDLPDIHMRVSDTLHKYGNGHDRSVAAFHLINLVADFIMREARLDAADMAGDRDVLKQISELCWEGAEHHDVIAEVMGHFEDHEYERAQLGYEVKRALNIAATDGKGPSHKGDVRVERQREVANINAAPEPAVSVLDASKAFIEWVKAKTPKGELLNKLEGKDLPAIKQPNTMANVRAVLRNANVSPRWDAMRDEPRFFVDPDAEPDRRRPWFNFMRATSRAGRDSRSAAELELLLDAMTETGMTARRELENFLVELAKEDPFHPLENYATSVAWDGVDRYGDVAGCLDADQYLAYAYMRVFFRSAVAAVVSLRNYMKTGLGVQIAGTVVLIGPQAIGKSTFWEKVTPPGMLSYGRALQIGQARETDSMAACLSGLVCPLNEIAQSLRRSDAEALKDFQSATVDKFRLPYGRRPITKPRMTVFVGTGNEDFGLQDQTGTRRYNVLVVRSIDWAGVNALPLQQLYAQAWHEVMEDGEHWWLTPEEDRERAKANEEHRAVSEEEAALAEYEATQTGHEAPRWLTMTMVCKLFGLRYSPHASARMRRLLLDAGYDYRNKVTEGKHVYRKVYAMPVLPERFDALMLRQIGR
jgi:predicted P-loop ATPase